MMRESFGDPETGAALERRTEPLAAMAEVDRPGPARRPPTVLLVDDDPDIVQWLSAYLRGAKLRVETALDGREALEKIRAAPPELIVSDVRMPGMNGYELCRSVRGSSSSAIPFIFCSSLGELPERVLGLRIGADDYIVKPIDPEELLLKIRLQLERSSKFRELRRLVNDRDGGVVLRGQLGEIFVPELLQFLGFIDLVDGRLRIDDGVSDRGEIFLTRGEVVHARAGERTGTKAFLRILGWRSGTFLVDHQIHDGARTISGSLEHCLLQGLAEIDQCRHLRRSLDATGRYFHVNHCPELFMRHFDEKTAGVLTLVELHHELDRVLAASDLTELEVLRIVTELLATGVLTAPLATPAR